MGNEVTIGGGAISASTRSVRQRRAVRGRGCVFRRGNVWWIAYAYRGTEQRESSESHRHTDAERLLKKRLEEIGRGRRVSRTTEAKITVNDLLDALETAYRNDGRRSVATLVGRIKSLREGLGFLRAVDVRGSHVERYKAERRAENKAPATVNRELAALRRAFNL